MKLTGNLKKQVDEAADIAEKKKLIEKAGMKLTDDELNMLAGGYFSFGNESYCEYDPSCHFAFTSRCSSCDKRR